MNDWPLPNKKGLTRRAWLAGLPLALLFDRMFAEQPWKSLCYPLWLVSVFPRGNKLVFLLLLTGRAPGSWFLSHCCPKSRLLPFLLVVVAGGAKHQGSGDVGEGAVGGQVLASSAVLCPTWPQLLCVLSQFSCSRCFVDNGEDGEKNVCVLLRWGGWFCDVYCRRAKYCSSSGLSGEWLWVGWYLRGMERKD